MYMYTYIYYSMCILTYMYMLAMTHHPLQHAPSISVGVLVPFFITDSTRHHHKCGLFCDLEGSKCTCSYTVTYSMSICTNVQVSNMTHHPLKQASSISVGVQLLFLLPTPPRTITNAYRQRTRGKQMYMYTYSYVLHCVHTDIHVYVSNDTSPTIPSQKKKNAKAA